MISDGPAPRWDDLADQSPDARAGVRRSSLTAAAGALVEPAAAAPIRPAPVGSLAAAAAVAGWDGGHEPASGGRTPRRSPNHTLGIHPRRGRRRPRRGRRPAASRRHCGTGHRAGGVRLACLGGSQVRPKAPSSGEHPPRIECALSRRDPLLVVRHQERAGLRGQDDDAQLTRQRLDDVQQDRMHPGGLRTDRFSRWRADEFIGRI